MQLRRRGMIGVVAVLAIAGCTQHTDRVPYALTIDLVECRAELERECLHFYEQNWKVFREAALQRGHISSYQILRSAADSASGPAVILITEYPDSQAFAHAEENFQPLMRELRPNGPNLLNGVARSEFVVTRTGFSARPLTVR